MKSLLLVENLAIEFKSRFARFRVPDGVSFTVFEGECVGLVGESGSGKSVTALAIMGLLPKNARITTGRIVFDGIDITSTEDHPRGRKMSMVFQNPLNSLNPNMKIGQQLCEVLIENFKMSKEEARKKVIETMTKLGIFEAEEMLERYPFEYSGGMRQRAMIAMAMLCEPKLLIADEPTTALDVTIQAQIMQLFRQLKCSSKTSILFISHDLSLVAQIADKVIVMYAGKICEISPTRKLFTAPLHPYTQGLISSIPDLKKRESKLHSIEGNVPSPLSPPSGCRFHPRCDKRLEICTRQDPPEIWTQERFVKCWLYEKAGV
ncbi:ABC transporter ATP-binding protein [Thermotoga caldifontis]|mgnify:CR=1 FL=1|uniref:ABC transporter ATP-binding protein n=1 Tax=Thermotoga caldifontis TaxID=1508419 RepID=UPI000596F98F|nr:ABC transporter ATP-binding protein [Thermotoga caldifontis]